MNEQGVETTYRETTKDSIPIDAQDGSGRVVGYETETRIGYVIGTREMLDLYKQFQSGFSTRSYEPLHPDSVTPKMTSEALSLRTWIAERSAYLEKTLDAKVSENKGKIRELHDENQRFKDMRRTLGDVLQE